MTRTIRAAVCAALFATTATASFATPAAAAQPVAATEKAKACSARYFKAMRMEKTMEAVTDSMANSMKGMLPPVGDEATRAKIERVTIKVMRETMEELMPQVMADLEPQMTAIFTEAELCALADFYEAPVGQSIIDKMPAMMEASMSSTRKYLPGIQKRMVESLCKELDCKGTQLEQMLDGAKSS